MKGAILVVAGFFLQYAFPRQGVAGAPIRTSARDLVAVDFVDEQHGWAVSFGGLILASTDGGLTWMNVGTTGGQAWDLDFVDRFSGYAAGRDLTYDVDLFRTADGGRTWKRAFGLENYYCSEGRTERVAVHESRLWLLYDTMCIIEPYLWHGLVLVADTTDVESTWRNPFVQEGGLHDLWVDGDNRKWIVGAWFQRQESGRGSLRGAVYYDGTTAGEDWNLQYADSLKGRVLRAITFTDSSSGWACGDSGIVIHTDDGSLWTEQNPGVSLNLNDIAFVTSQVGWAVGDSGTVLATLDGGLTWNRQNSGSRVSLNAIAALSTDRVVVVGDDLTILYTQDGGNRWEPVVITRSEGDRQTSQPVRLVLYPNHPNPFNAQTVIRFDLPNPGRVSLRITNLLGQEIARLVDGWLPAGSHRVVWDGTSGGTRVKSGVYFYELRTEGVVKSRKLLVLR